MPSTARCAAIAVGEVALDELDAVAQVVLVAGDEVVDDPHAVAARDERFGKCEPMKPAPPVTR